MSPETKERIEKKIAEETRYLSRKMRCLAAELLHHSEKFEKEPPEDMMSFTNIGAHEIDTLIAQITTMRQIIREK